MQGAALCRAVVASSDITALRRALLCTNIGWRLCRLSSRTRSLWKRPKKFLAWSFSESRRTIDGEDENSSPTWMNCNTSPCVSETVPSKPGVSTLENP